MEHRPEGSTRNRQLVIRCIRLWPVSEYHTLAVGCDGVCMVPFTIRYKFLRQGILPIRASEKRGDLRTALSHNGPVT